MEREGEGGNNLKMIFEVESYIKNDLNVRTSKLNREQLLNHI